MDIKEAKEIIDAYEKWSDASCTCHLGHPPCSKCENLPPKEIYEEALMFYNQAFIARLVRKTEYTTVICTDTPGKGNACHSYIITANNLSTFIPTYVLFQNGPIKENGVNGCQNEDLLAIVIDRLEGFQSGDFACEDNHIALQYLRAALNSLEHRTVNRKARGVEGRLIK